MDTESQGIYVIFFVKPNKVRFAFCPCPGLWFFTKHFSWDLNETETAWCPWTINEPQMGNASQKNTRPYMTLILALQKKNTFQPQLVGDSEGKW